MKTYLFNTEALGGYMLQGNPHKRHLKTEVTGEGQDRVVTKLNEIRLTDLTFESGETLRIVDDEIVVVPRPDPPVVVPDEVDFWKIKTVLQLLGKWDNVLAVANTLPDEQKIPILNGLQHAATMTRVHPLVQLMISIPALDITAEQMDAIFVAAQQYD